MITLLTPFGEAHFEIRADSKTDKAVLKEILAENVYHVHSNMLSDNGTVLDVGANIGAFTIDILLRAHVERKRIHVVAVEPQPQNLALLKRNLQLNKRLLEHGSKVTIVEKAIGDQPGTVKISNEHGSSRIADEGVEVEMITLNELFSRYQLVEVGFAKFDIEGSEVPALLAAPDDTIDAMHRTAIEFDDHNGLDNFGKLINRFGRKCSFYTLGVPARGCYIYTERHIL